MKEKIEKLMKSFGKEGILFAFWGGVTTVIGIGILAVLYDYAGIDYKIANLISIILVKLLSYLTNKYGVFMTTKKSLWENIKEFVAFFCARGFTGLVDYFGMIVAVEVFGLGVLVTKCGMFVIITSLNFLLGKKLVFKKSTKEPVVAGTKAAA